MALLSKRKRPSREDKPIKEISKIASKVFDNKTVSVLVDFLNNGTFDSLDYPIASGKEAMVFRASVGKDFVAVKVFKYETSSFHHMLKYVIGDPRFKADKVKHNKRGLVQLWAKKEYANLQGCLNAGVRVPEALGCKENVVVMELLGKEGVPCALLEDVVVAEPQKMLDDILDDVKKIYAAGLVHADLSSFNIIVKDEIPYIIDLGQAVSLQHPLAQEFLEKDVLNVLSYFEKLGAEKDFKATLEWIKS